jgi:pimeloyl-ACP methyl ester carboxylesterase
MSFIYNYLPLEHRACIAACVMAYNFDVPQLPGDRLRTDFSVSAESSKVSFRYVKPLSNESIATFLRDGEAIIAFRGTQLNSPSRFLGMPNSILSPAEQELPALKRANILASYCPARAGVGCSKLDPVPIPTDRPDVIDPRQSDFELRKRFKLGRSMRAGRSMSRSRTLYLDGASDCVADEAIVYQQEYKSRLHQLCADNLERLLDALFARGFRVYVTGHSLGGSLAAFALWNYPNFSKQNVSLVLFTAGSGPGTAGLVDFASQFIQCKDKISNARGTPELRRGDLVPKRSSYKPMPRDPFEWTIPVVMYREICDVVSAFAVSWFPTISFVFQRNEGQYCDFAPRKTDSHSLETYMPDKIFRQWGEPSGAVSDHSKHVSGFQPNNANVETLAYLRGGT